jgi:hypothetical protein
VAASVVLIVVGRPAMMHAGAGDCDNLAGECLAHARQVDALTAIGWTTYVAATCSLAAAVWVLARPRWVVATIVIVVALALGITGLIIDPVDHLQNPRHGWFGGHEEW